jgi:hypothetical protein
MKDRRIPSGPSGGQTLLLIDIPCRPGTFTEWIRDWDEKKVEKTIRCDLQELFRS